VDIPESGIVFRLPGKVCRDESTAGTISLISFGMKPTGERSAGKLHAAFDVAGAGNVVWPRCCDTCRRKGKTTGKTNIDLNRRASTRPYVCPEKAGMFSRRQSCRGKSQKPRSLDSRVAGNQYSEAYRQGHREGGCESSGRNESERRGSLESDQPWRSSNCPYCEDSMGRRNLTETAYHSSGVVATAR
jgi:hypothetical protein